MFHGAIFRYVRGRTCVGKKSAWMHDIQVTSNPTYGFVRKYVLVKLVDGISSFLFSGCLQPKIWMGLVVSFSLLVSSTNVIFSTPSFAIIYSMIGVNLTHSHQIQVKIRLVYLPLHPPPPTRRMNKERGSPHQHEAYPSPLHGTLGQPHFRQLSPKLGLIIR